MPIEIPVKSPLAPQMPTEPPPEVLKQTFEFDPSKIGNHDSSDSTITIDKQEVKTELSEVKKELVGATVEVKKEPEVKKEEPKKDDKISSVLKAPVEEKPKVEEKKVAQVEEPKEKKEVIKTITPVKEKGEDSFDYTKYAPQEVTNMKNMSRQSREAYARVLDENKQLSGLKDSTYLQHEQAYTLSPEYQTLQSKAYAAQSEGSVWERALLNIRAGKPYQEPVGIDKNGQFIMSKELQPSDRDEIRINQNLMACNQVSQQANGQLQAIPNQFKQRIAQDLQSIQQEQHQRFAWVQDPKLLDYSIAIEGKGDTKIKDIKADFKNIWPSYLQNNPAVDVASNLFVALQIQAAELREARNGQQVAQIKQAEISRGEPSSETQPVKETLKTVGDGRIPAEFKMGSFEVK